MLLSSIYMIKFWSEILNTVFNLVLKTRGGVLENTIWSPCPRKSSPWPRSLQVSKMLCPRLEDGFRTNGSWTDGSRINGSRTNGSQDKWVPDKWVPDKWVPDKWVPDKWVPGQMGLGKMGPRTNGSRTNGSRTIGSRTNGSQINGSQDKWVPGQMGPRTNGSETNECWSISSQDLDCYSTGMSTTKIYGGSLVTNKYAEKSEYIFINRAIKFLSPFCIEIQRFQHDKFYFENWINTKLTEQFFSTFKSSCAVGALSGQIVWRFCFNSSKEF